MECPEIIIAGGGLAGLAAGIHLAKQGRSVLIIEKSSYPAHKVCGEYLSNEILPYLKWLGVDIEEAGAISINRFSFTDLAAKPVSAVLDTGGVSITRHELDYRLYLRAIELGCVVEKSTVKEIAFDNDRFTVRTDSSAFRSGVVLGAFGKWSNIDKSLGRKFSMRKSSWLAVKGHYRADFPGDTVALYTFPGGYCGVSRVEDGIANICYLAGYDLFSRYKNIKAYEEEVVFSNPKLREIMQNSALVFDKPVAISQVSFAKKNTVENHILMIGDSAGVIHPLCGNGMAMAMHSAKLAAELSLEFLDGTISRTELELNYTRLWKKHFGKRLFMGRLLAGVMAKSYLLKPAVAAVRYFPLVMRFLIRQTHGKPVAVS